MRKLLVMLMLVTLCSSPMFVQASGGNDGCTINLKPGWNLVGSSQTKMVVEVIHSATAEINSAWKYDKATEQWAFFSPVALYDGQIFAKEHGYKFFASIYPGDGYWIEAKTKGTINVCAEELPPGVGDFKG